MTAFTIQGAQVEMAYRRERLHDEFVAANRRDGAGARRWWRIRRRRGTGPAVVRPATAIRARVA